MTKAENSLLVYLETCAVDASGAVDARRVNTDDLATMQRWNEQGFVLSGRISSDGVAALNRCGVHASMWAWLSPEAWAAAHTLRQERADRTWAHRIWQTTEEKRAS